MSANSSHEIADAVPISNHSNPLCREYIEIVKPDWPVPVPRALEQTVLQTLQVTDDGHRDSKENERTNHWQ